MVKSVTLTDSGFVWAEGMGASNFQQVSQGQLLGYVGRDELRTAYDAHFLFPKLPELWVQGKPIMWLAARV